MPRGLLIVAGAGPGISQATARHFGGQGYTVGLIARREQALRKFQDELTTSGVRSLSRVADCASEIELAAALAEIQAEAGAPDALLYNAANIRWKNLLDETAAALTADFMVNVAGALTAVRAVLPAMRAANKGTLLFTGSMFAENPVPAFGSLSIGKAGLRSLTHSLATALQETALKVHFLSIQGQVTADNQQRSPMLIAARCWELHSGSSGLAPVDVVI